MSVDKSTSNATSHARWIQLVMNLDGKAWESLLRLYAADLRHDIQISLGRRGLPAEWLDDIEQETWLTAIRKIKGFVWESDERFYHWLRAISLNHVRVYQRQMGNTVSIDDVHTEDASGENVLDLPALREENTEEQVVLHEQLSALDKVMRQLSVRDREIFLRWLMGEPPQQLALVYSLKARSISQLVLRAKQKLVAVGRVLNNEGKRDV